jgi:hypothetical protein
MCRALGFIGIISFIGSFSDMGLKLKYYIIYSTIDCIYTVLGAPSVTQ